LANAVGQQLSYFVEPVVNSCRLLLFQLIRHDSVCFALELEDAQCHCYISQLQRFLTIAASREWF
jgi:hypothetical protein